MGTQTRMTNQRSRHRWIARTVFFSVLILSYTIPAPDAFVLSSPFAAPRPPSVALSCRSATDLHMAAKSGGKIVTSEEEFEKLALSESNPRAVMVFFTAPWCGPCRLSIPVVKEVIKEYSGQIDSVEVCTDDLPEVASNAGVVSIPTIQIYYQGEVKDTIVGCVAKKVLSMAVEKILEDLNEQAPNGDGSS